jgi:hypothetical protein
MGSRRAENVIVAAITYTVGLLCQRTSRHVKLTLAMQKVGVDIGIWLRGGIG